MKKLFIIGALAMATIATSCSGNGTKNEEFEGFDTLFTAAQTDTLIELFGTMAGNQVRQQFERAMSAEPNLRKADFMRGVQYAFAADTTTAYGYGMQVGQRLLNQVKLYQSQGLNFRDGQLLESFKAAFMSDSALTPEAMSNGDIAFQRLDGQLREAQAAFARIKVENSEECKANVARGRAYVDSIRKADANYVVTASGVAYKIDSLGQGDKLVPSNRIKMSYTASTLDGKVVDRRVGAAENLRPTLISNLEPGLAEVLTEVPVGTKFTAVVPGPEAYGIDKAQRYGVGPNETIIFDVEVLDVMQPQSASGVQVQTTPVK